MAMNIAKLQSQLQRVPDEALINYVQNPNGQVPSYLALTELTRRKEMRNAGAQSAQGAQKQPSVADQIVQESQPQGVAGLQLPDEMYNEQSMAAGGIVAFDEGGEVPSFAGPEGSLVRGLTQDDIAYQRALAATGDPTEGGQRVLSYMADVISSPGQLAWVRDPKTNKLVRAYETEGWFPRTSGFTAKQDKAKQNRASQLDAYEADNITRANLAGKKVPLGSTREGIKQLVADATAPEGAMVDRMFNIPTNKPTVQNIESPSPRFIGDPNRSVPNAGTGMPSQGGQPVRNQYGDLVFPEIKPDTAGFDALAPKERAMRDYAAEFRTELGDDPGRAAMKERLATMQAAGEKEANQAPWMALAEAGLGMAAGKSQFALQNIAEGGLRGVKAYSEARDNLRKAEERRFDLESKVAQAERAEQLAAIKYGEESKRTEDAGRRAVGLAKQEAVARANEINAKGKFEAVKDKYQFQQKDREINLMTQRLDKQIASVENQSLRNDMLNRRDSLKTALNELNDLMKNEQSSLNPDPAKLASLQQKFNSAYNALYSLAMQPSGAATSGAPAMANRPPLSSPVFNLK
jgi:hypothetical protein